MTGYAYYNDNEQFCADLLRVHVTLGHLPEGYVDERDIRDLHATDFVGYSHVHLFAGIGGFPLAMQWAGYPEHIRTLTGGFPCQDVSTAGKRVGITGERSGLWKEMLRLISEATACDMGFEYILLENVSALVNRGLSTVLADLAQAGYDAEWCCLRASDIGAPHQRERIFVMAYLPSIRSNPRRSQSEKQQRKSDLIGIGETAISDTDRDRCWQWQDQQERQPERQRTAIIANDGPEELVAHPAGRRERKHRRTREAQGAQHYVEQSGARNAQSAICGVLNGLSDWVDRFRWPAGPDQEQADWEPRRVISGRQKTGRVARLKALGNAIVPQLPMILALHVMAYDREVNA